MVNPFADATNYEDCIRECAIRANKSNFPHSLPLTSKIKDAQEATEKLLELQEPFIKRAAKDAQLEWFNLRQKVVRTNSGSHGCVFVLCHPP